MRWEKEAEEIEKQVEKDVEKDTGILIEN